MYWKQSMEYKFRLELLSFSGKIKLYFGTTLYYRESVFTHRSDRCLGAENLGPSSLGVSECIWTCHSESHRSCTWGPKTRGDIVLCSARHVPVVLRWREAPLSCVGPCAGDAHPSRTRLQGTNRRLQKSRKRGRSPGLPQLVHSGIDQQWRHGRDTFLSCWGQPQLSPRHVERGLRGAPCCANTTDAPRHSGEVGGEGRCPSMGELTPLLLY